MLKFLFFDYRNVGALSGFERKLQQPVKHSHNPLFLSEEPWENGNLTLYGSVVKRPDGPFQLWYTVVREPFQLTLAYAESDDGLVWRKPLFDFFLHEGRKTNVLLADELHGAAIIYDANEPQADRKYKMLAGKGRRGPIHGYCSADGIRWTEVSRFPVITTRPDCPIGLLRARDGRYVAYHRNETFGRRVFRSESWDFKHWSSEPRLVLEPDAGDAPLTQFYGLGSTGYGPFEIGTLWMYRVDQADPSGMSGYQEAELTYARSGHAWHRAAQGTAFIPHGAPGTWEQGNLQCASAPLLLEDEIRYYYAATDINHSKDWELKPHRAGIGLAVLKPDRFVALEAGEAGASLVTQPFVLPSADIRVNADIAPDGWIGMEILDEHYQPLEGFELQASPRLTGDALDHRLVWSAGSPPVGATVRLKIDARHAKLYSIYLPEGESVLRYDEFRSL